jgi:hypothetical protein
MAGTVNHRNLPEAIREMHRILEPQQKSPVARLKPPAGVFRCTAGPGKEKSRLLELLNGNYLVINPAL